jgi:hypothetical protein
MKVYQLNDCEYYSYDDLHVNYPSLTKGCGSKKDFIERNDIPYNYWRYARMVKGILTETEGKSRTVDKLYVWKNHVDEVMIKGLAKIVPKPVTIHLSVDEMFKGPDGELLEIEVVGERTMKGIYFRLEDVSVAFNMKKLDNVVTRCDRNSYTKDIHYKSFTTFVTTTNGGKTAKKTAKKVSNKTELYLTYLGLIRAIFTTRSPLAMPYVEWACETLFAVQMGDIKQKRLLAEKITGITPATLKELGKTNVTTMPCVYLFSIGTVKNLRKSMGLGKEYKDQDSVYKLGYTNNLPRRADDHDKNYGQIEGAAIKLVYHSYIDVRYIAEAEAVIKKIFTELGLRIKYEKYTELAVIPADRMSRVKEHYVTIGTMYMGCVKELTAKMVEMDHINKNAILEKNIEISKMETKLSDKNNEITKKDVEIAHMGTRLSDKNNEITKKDVEIAHMETKLSRKDNEIMKLKHMLEKAGIIV